MGFSRASAPVRQVDSSDDRASKHPRSFLQSRRLGVGRPARGHEEHRIVLRQGRERGKEIHRQMKKYSQKS